MAIDEHFIGVLQQAFRHVRSRAQGTRDVEKMLHFQARVEHHAHESDFLERWAQLLDVLAKRAAVQWCGHDGTASGFATRRVGMVVGESRHGHEMHVRFSLEEFDGARTVAQKCVRSLFVEPGAGLVLHVDLRLAQVVLYA